MKKTMIIALLAVLVLGAFTACNGDVNAELFGSRTITLEIPSEWGEGDDWYYCFDNGTRTKIVEVPSGCDTWAQFLEKETGITVTEKYYDYSYTYTLKVFTNETPATRHGKIYFFNESDYPVLGLVLETKAYYANPETTEASAKIVLGGTYVLTMDDSN